MKQGEEIGYLAEALGAEAKAGAGILSQAQI